VLVCSERRVLLVGCWWLVCSERKVLVAAKRAKGCVTVAVPLGREAMPAPRSRQQLCSSSPNLASCRQCRQNPTPSRTPGPRTAVRTGHSVWNAKIQQFQLRGQESDPGYLTSVLLLLSRTSVRSCLPFARSNATFS
jgi:hypothetical protein